ncbi:LysE family transporter [Dehalobacterium formicoaceticum]|uniref:LysE family translocator n=1 Tax=Dehalobacterium formicoaceticum TaxID=51515 RepID=A0ABT1Y126_9FIRM|nr:LysE family transporter [Dehalobacterium formicoaceticum]MCR6544566.1 LysE family translocator [Dehalobacterium formicoaceticum]
MLLIFTTALALGFSGAMMPGPLLTYTIRQSLNTGPLSGFIITLGHALLEVILIALIFLGFDIILQSDMAQIIIGIIGGLLLIFMGIEMIVNSAKNKIKIEMEHNGSDTKNMLLSGAVISAANPYFLIWWVIIGLGFLLEAYKSFGPLGVLVFYVGHISADFIWYGLVSTVVGSTRKFIKENIYRIIIAVLGGLLVFFGGNFIYKAVLQILQIL